MGIRGSPAAALTILFHQNHCVTFALLRFRMNRGVERLLSLHRPSPFAMCEARFPSNGIVGEEIRQGWRQMGLGYSGGLMTPHKLNRNGQKMI